jgi:hypothetical protein
MVQNAPDPMLVPQVLVCENPAGVVIPEILSAVAPVLVRVTVNVLDPFSLTDPKFRVYGTSSTVPVPTVMAVVADFVLSSTEVATRVTAGTAGAFAGAV